MFPASASTSASSPPSPCSTCCGGGSWPVQRTGDGRRRLTTLSVTSSPRLFVAVWPPDTVLERVAALERPVIEGVRWTTRDKWHVTLRFFGPADVETVRSALAGVDAAPAIARLGPAVGRFGNRILHVPVSGLERVASAVIAATSDIGRPPDDRPFAGHLTLARVAKGARVDLRLFAGAAVAGSWDVTDVCLVQSHLSPAGSRYEVLDRFRF
ncbi:MAG TPA: RNA 2',3'-cyclic phosphodiesterase [Acidimicrobiales bacterium]|nr:RNA 2',3'-cyclic phosphodiesterase [Acidimicrobiales bacterium]